MIGCRAALFAAAGLAAAGLSACETTQETSSRLAKGAKDVVQEHGLKLGRPNADVAVTGSAVLQDTNGTAAVVLLRNRGAAQADVPVAISLTSRKGKVVYANDIPGLDKSLTSLAVIGAKQRTFWVNDQIQPAARPRKASAKVGGARAAARGPFPRLELTKVRYESDTDGLYAGGVVTNRSKVPQVRLVISCISRRGDRIIAAGRAIVDRLLPAPTPKPTTFRVYFIGNPKGGALVCTAPPTVLSGGTS